MNALHLPAKWRSLHFSAAFRKYGLVPLALLILLALCFAWFIPLTGFYWDDWPVILTARLRGLSALWHFYEYDRPFSAWTYVLTLPLLGTQTLSWQLFTLALRWLTAVALWTTLSLLWPKRQDIAISTALLFAVYPIFAQQPISVAYSQHWICYLLFMLSLAGMLASVHARVRHPRWYGLLTVLSVLAFLIEALTLEYFLALELIRPLLLWFLARQMRAESVRAESASPPRLSWLRCWVPYLLGLVGLVIWRFFFLKLPYGDPNAPTLISQLLANPIQGTLQLLQTALQDLLQLFLGAWAQMFDPAGIDLKSGFLLATWAAAGIAAAAAFFFLKRMEPGTTDKETTLQGICVGLSAAVLGLVPAWTIGRQMIAGLHSDRFGLAAMWGASLFLVCVVTLLITDPRRKILVLSLLIGLATANQIHIVNDYRWAWVKQSRFYWQLKWRAPQLQPQTALFSEGEIFPYMGVYPTGAALNVLYNTQLPGDDLPFWFFSLNRSFTGIMPDFIRGIPISGDIRNYQFKGSSHDGLVLFYQPETNSCLEILAPGDEDAPGLDVLTRQALQVSSLSRILPDEENEDPPANEVFGPEPEHAWCYLYEKAALARQLGDWTQVSVLAQQAKAAGYTPQTSSSDTPFEWLPFIEGAARTGDWSQASQLSLEAYARDKRIDTSLCRLWKGLEPSASGVEAQSKVAEVNEQVGCPE